MDPLPNMKLSDLPEETNEVSGEVLDAAIEVHRALGPGLLEGAYRDCLAYELRERGIATTTEQVIPLRYKAHIVETAFRADLVVANRVIVEVKCVEALAPEHTAQLLTYLRASGLQLGILLNFHAPRLRDGFRRLVLSSP